MNSKPATHVTRLSQISKKILLAGLIGSSFASQADAQTFSFQQGTNLTGTTTAYAGTVDTYIRNSSSTTNFNTNVNITIDGGDATFQDGVYTQGLIRFDSIFGTGTGLIPAGSIITNATLTVRTGTASNDQSGNTFGIYRLNTGFDGPTVTWANSYGGNGIRFAAAGTAAAPPIPLDSLEAAPADSTAAGGGVQGNLVTFNVTPSLSTFSAAVDPALANLGWLITPVAGTDGWVFASANNATIANRPLLTVSFVPAGGQNVTWVATNTTGTLDTVLTNTPWVNDSAVASAFKNGDTIKLSQNPASPVTITVDSPAGGIAPLVTDVTHSSGSYTLTGGSIGSALNKTGAGTLALNSANQFGAVTLTDGLLQTGNGNALGTTGTLTLSGTGILNPTSSQVTTKNFDLAGGTVQVDGTNVFESRGSTIGTGTINKTGTGTWAIQGTNNGAGFTGTIDVQAGRLIVQGSTVSPAAGDLNASSIIVRNGAAFQFGTTPALTGENPDFPNTTYITLESGSTADWYVGEDFGGINYQGGTLNIRGGGPNTAGTASVIQSGTINGLDATTTPTARTLSFAAAGSTVKNTTGTLTLNNITIDNTGPFFIDQGTIATNSPITGTGIMTLGSSTSTATLQFTNTGALTVAKNLQLDAVNGGEVNVQNASANVVMTGVLSTGILNKSGPGTLQLTGANTNPVTNVNAGTVSYNSVGLSSTSTVSVADAATLSKSDLTTTAITGLNLGGTNGGNLVFNLAGNTTTELLSITGTDALVFNAVAAGGNKIIINTSAPFAAGTFPLINYEGTIGGTGAAFVTSPLTLVLPQRVTGSLSNDTVNSMLNVTITGTDSIRWTGATNTTWDINTSQNWREIINGVNTNYLEAGGSADVVTFDDFPLAASPLTVNLPGVVNPASVSFTNATKDYVLNGIGSISGGTTVAKSGAGAVTLNTANNYTGATSISAGTLTLAGANNLGGAVNVTGGTLNMTVAQNITGLTTVSAGALNITAGSTLAGGLSVSGGTVTLPTANTIGAVVLTGGLTEIGVTNALGASGTAISLGGTATLRATATQDINRVVSFDAGAGSTIEVTGTNVLSLIGNTAGGNNTLNKTGTGTLNITGASSSFTGTLNINAGRVHLVGTTAAPGNGNLNATQINVNAGTTFQFGTTPALTDENPDLPGNTFITLFTGGTADWHVGEDFGGINMDGGTLNMFTGNTNFTSGTTIWNSGSIISTGAAKNISVQNAGTSLIKATAGIVNITANANLSIAAGGSLSVNEGTINTAGTLTMSAQTATANAGTTTINGGTFNTTNSITLNAGDTVNSLAGGNLTIESGLLSSTGAITVNNLATLNLNGGVLQTSGTITGAGQFTIGTAGPGATLRLSNTGPQTIAKAVTLDAANGATIEVQNAASVATYSGIISGGALTKTGPGTLSLTAVNDLTGAINVNAGVLAATATALPATAQVTVANLGTFAKSDVAAASTIGGLTLGSTEGGILGFNLTGNPTLGTALLNIANNDAFVVNGTAGNKSKVVLTSSVPLTTGTFPLIDYAGNITGTGGLSNLQLVLPQRVVGSLLPDTNDPTILNVSITGIDSIKWTGASDNTWTINSPTTDNWQLVTGGTATDYLQDSFSADTVLFDGSASGVGPITVSIPADVAPFAVTFNNSTRNYSVGGTGLITGTTGLNKDGTGTLSLTSANSFTGVVNLNAGTLSIVQDALGTSAANLNISGNATLVAAATQTLNRNLIVGTSGGTINVGGTDNLQLNGSTEGTTTLTKTGTGTLAITGTNGGVGNVGFTGTLDIQAGRVILSGRTGTPGAGDLNATSILVQNGAAFQFGAFPAISGDNPDLPATTYITANTGSTVDWYVGESLGGFNLNGGALNFVAAGISADGASPNSFTSGTITGTAASLAFGGTAAVNKTTSGTVTITNAALNSAGGINILEGMISTDSAISNTGALTLGDVTTAGTLQLRHATAASFGKTVTLNAGGGAIDVQNAAGDITWSAVISGAGSLTKAGAGNLTLTAVNTYTGDTTVSGGRLITGNITGPGNTTASAAGTSVAPTLIATDIDQTALTINNGAYVRIAPSGTSTSVVTALTVGTTANLDITNNDMIVNNPTPVAAASNLTAVAARVNSGFAGGDGIVSTTMGSGLETVGFGLNSFLSYPTFNGVAVNDDSVLIKYTYFGDSNLDGFVTDDDLGYFLAGYGSDISANPWILGDYNHDGFTTDDDLGFFLAAYGSTPGLAGGSIQAIPEPSTLVLGTLAGLGLGALSLRRRRAK